MRIVVAATFTVEPVGPVIDHLAGILGEDISVVLGPYNQVFQTLLDPNSEFATNTEGVNALVVRLEDWCPPPSRLLRFGWRKKLDATWRQLEDALRAAQARNCRPCFLLLCPPSESAQRAYGEYDDLELELLGTLKDIDDVHVTSSRDLLTAYVTRNVHDPARDRLGHIPYTDEFFAALGATMVRRVLAVLRPPFKVIAVDCDNTLWSGVVGEDGPLGVEVTEGHKALQERLRDLAATGFLVCVVSKNEAADVDRVFEENPGMKLLKSDIAAERANWRPKSDNLRELADDLGVGLDSFVFLDDSPIECAEVAAALPQVVTIRIPESDDIPRLVDHVWAFDQVRITTEDKARTGYYQAQGRRAEARRAVPTLREFLDQLELRVVIRPANDEDVPRLAQLTQRTNQFHCHTVRRDEDAIRTMVASDSHDCLAASVADKFGDYGLVGLLIAEKVEESLVVSTFLLSCRALGRGVEHRMLAAVGSLAEGRGIATVGVRFVATDRNTPAAEFLGGLGTVAESEDGATTYRLPSPQAAAVDYRPDDHASSSSADSDSTANPTTPPTTRSTGLAHIAVNLQTAAAIHSLVHPKAVAPDGDAENDVPAQVRTMLTRLLATAGSDVGFSDDDSLVTSGRLSSLNVVDLAVQLETAFGVDVAVDGFDPARLDSVRAIVDLVSQQNR
jgi:FkbH-like protein